MGEAEDSGFYKQGGKGKLHNVLPLWGNEQTMNLNPLVLANIQGSSYFKVHLFKLKTYHEVVDEIYYQVKHLEPWERGSRKTAGQTGMCGGVRGVGAGGIVSTAFCLLYKLYTLRLTRKQVNGLLQHTDSPFIRALGFMYIRYTQPPADLFDWYEQYLEDEEEVDAKAGGGQPTTVGALVRQMLVKLDWFSTLFPRIPVPIQKQIEQRLAEHNRQVNSYKPAPTSTWGGSGSGAAPGRDDRRGHDDREDRRGHDDREDRRAHDDREDRRGHDDREDRRGHDDRVERGEGNRSYGEAEKYSRERNSKYERDGREDKDRDRRDDKDRDRKERDRNTHRERDRNAYKERERETHRDRDRQSDRGRNRERSRSRERQRDRRHR